MGLDGRQMVIGCYCYTHPAPLNCKTIPRAVIFKLEDERSSSSLSQLFCSWPPISLRGTQKCITYIMHSTHHHHRPGCIIWQTINPGFIYLDGHPGSPSFVRSRETFGPSPDLVAVRINCVSPRGIDSCAKEQASGALHWFTVNARPLVRTWESLMIRK